MSKEAVEALERLRETVMAHVGRSIDAEEEAKTDIATIRAALQQQEGRWQPIETAPKDGTHVLMGWRNGDMRVAYWLEDHEEWEDAANLLPLDEPELWCEITPPEPTA